jgi:hypothetical protein
MLVLLWGLPGDTPITAVRKQLAAMEVPTVFVDQRAVLETEVDLEVADEVNGWLRIGNERCDLSAVTAIYQRPYLSTQISTIVSAGVGSPAWRHAAQIDEILASWCEITPAFVVNRASAMASNDSKPYQLQLIRRFEWSVPETLITSDPEAARAFWEQHGNVIYKSISGIRSRVSRLQPEHVERFSNLSSCPTQFQRYILGTDYRVHVVGTEVFACEVVSTADDYRYPTGESPLVQKYTLPPDVEERCRRMAAAMKLWFAGIDLRQTPDGEWFCFEVNPSPGFSYYENSTGQPISEAVAHLLAGDHPKSDLFGYPLLDAEPAVMATHDL